MNLSALLFLIALVVFILASLGVAIGTIPLLPFGLAFIAGGLLVGALGDHRIG